MAQDIRSQTHWSDQWLQDLMLSCMPITEDDQATVITTPQRTIIWTTLEGGMARSATDGKSTSYDWWNKEGVRRVHPYDRNTSPTRHYV